MAKQYIPEVVLYSVIIWFSAVRQCWFITSKPTSLHLVVIQMCFPTERDTPVSTWIQSHNNHSWFTVFTVPWATSCNTQTGYLIHLNPSSLIGVYLMHLKYAWDDDSCAFLCAEGSKTKCSRSAPTVKFFHKNTHIHIYNVYDCAPKTIAYVQPTFPPCGSMSDRCPAY